MRDNICVFVTKTPNILFIFLFIFLQGLIEIIADFKRKDVHFSMAGCKVSYLSLHLYFLVIVYINCF